MIDSQVERNTMRQVSLRLLPFLFLLYILCYLDRTNVGIAALRRLIWTENVGFLKQKTGGDAGAFFGLATLALVGSLVLIGLRQRTVFKPVRTMVVATPAVRLT